MSNHHHHHYRFPPLPAQYHHQQQQQDLSSSNNNNNNNPQHTSSNNNNNNMTSQRFCLRWNNHQSNLLSVFDQLLHEESFVDVTLAVEGQLLRAHKMVLSACSPYFQALFVNHPDKHPIVILKDVPYSDMRSLLDFMYRGEVSVDQDRLTAFLRVAESLRIKGLTEVNEEKCDTITSSLTQHSNQMNQGMPHLQRLQQKRFGHPLNMLGNALLQPKRKRGRPRKLSGSSNGTPADDFDRDGSSLVQGSPEMLEVKMGMDGFTGNNSDCSTGKSDAKDNDLDMMDGLTGGDHHHNVKEEREPMAGTSKDGATGANREQRQQQQDESFNNAKSSDEFQSSEEYYDYPENNQNHTNLPATITVELLPQTVVKQETVIISTEAARNMLGEAMDQDDEQQQAMEPMNAGVHFLTDDDNMLGKLSDNGDLSYEKKKHELLEYLTRHDGSVVCKLCGEVLASRTHWYRHKYKLHVNNMVNPAPLFKCTHCSVFFKSRKGYMGHISARHSENMEQHEELNISIKEEVVETTSEKLPKKKQIVAEPPAVVLGAGHGNGSSATATISVATPAGPKSADWEEQRVKEEKLVADIIDRVRKECEAQGAAVSRRGYSRRSTVMNSCN